MTADPFVLAADTLIIGVEELPQSVRDGLGGEAGFALTRARSRTASTLVDRTTGELLREFTGPSTIAEVMIRYGRRTGRDPERLLDGSYPILRRCIGHGYLVPATSAGARDDRAGLVAGSRVAGGVILRCVQRLDDTEVYQLARDDGAMAALKLVVAPVPAQGEAALRREAAVLRHLDGQVAPSLLEIGTVEAGSWIAMGWCPGVRAGVLATTLRRSGGTGNRLTALCRAVIDAYARLHELGVVHGDVHPGNVLVAPDGSVRLVDFGLAHRRNDAVAPPRGGAPPYLDPEQAAALLAGRMPDPATVASDQYSLGALLYELLTGAGYLDLVTDRPEMLRRIVEDPPLPFTRRGQTPAPQVEALLAVTLAKAPADRFHTTAELARRWAGASSSTTTTGTGVETLLDDVLARARPGGDWFEDGLPSAPLASIAYGTAGLTAALYRVAVLRDDPELLALADEWALRASRQATTTDAFLDADRMLTEDSIGRVSPFHRETGVHAVLALLGHAGCDVGARQRGIDAFVAGSRLPCAGLDLTLGRAGTLLGASILREAVGAAPHVDLTGLETLGHDTMAGIWLELDATAPVTDSAKVPYLGMAHGWAGLAYATLRWCAATGAAHPAGLGQRLGQLAELARPAGTGLRWACTNRHLPGGEATTSGWCNGTAGYVHLWTCAHVALGEDRWAQLAERAAWDTYTTASDGIGQLCCGLGGRAYALLEMHRRTGEPRWLAAAAELAERAAVLVSVPNPQVSLPGSLHKGDVGVAVLAADLARPDLAAMPFFGNET